MAENTLDWLRSQEGWGALNNEEPSTEERQADAIALNEEFEEAKLYFEVFSTGRGPELIDRLREALWETPIYQIHGTMAYNRLEIPLSPDQWCWVRVGQNSVLHHIKAMLRKALEGPPTVPTQEQQT